MSSELQRRHPLSELQPAAALQDYGLQAVDGAVGSVEEFFFDDVTWTVRYLVVDTGSWLVGRRVLISPVAVGEVREREGLLYIELTREQIRNSPPLNSDKPVSRRYEARYYRYYGWPPYWEPASLTGVLLADAPATPPAPGPQQPEETRLRSSAEVTGYAIAAQDGELGRVEDFIIDTRYWAVRYVEVDTRNWWPGRRVLLSPRWIASVNWARRRVTVNLARTAIRSAPAYHRGMPISREYEARLFGHYGRRAYWGAQDDP
ncbi:MAG: PRC-barrel domain-containing protein [Gammaproteobacteria bacterium]|jgi:hypothetical protein